MTINELKKNLETKKEETRNLLNENKVDEAEGKMQEIRDLEKQIKLTEELEERELKELNEQQEERKEGNKNMENREILSIAEKEERAFLDFVREQRGLTKADNGAIVPTTIANRIIEKVKELSPIYSLATVYNVSGQLVIPIYDESTSSIGAAYQGSEFSELTEGTGNFKSVNLDGFVVGTLAKISKSLINNTNIDVTTFVINKVAQSISDFLEKELLEGKTKIKGLVNTTNVVTSSVVGKISTDDLIDTQMTIPDIYLNNAVWIMNKTDFAIIRKLKDANGQYIMNKDFTKGFGYEILGNHVYVSQNATSVYFGDMTGLSVKLSSNMELTQLIEKYATQNAIGYCAFAEVDAKITNTQKIVKLVKKVS